MAVTPAVIAMVSAALTYLATEVVSAAKEESAEVIRQKTKDLFARLFSRQEKKEESTSADVQNLPMYKKRRQKKVVASLNKGAIGSAK